MRATLLVILIGGDSWADDAFGVCKVNRARSTHTGSQKDVILPNGPHTHGEVLTLDTVGSDGRASTSSTILYFDGTARDFQDLTCSGTQSSRRVDSRTVELLRSCTGGESIRLVRRLTGQQGKLILEITEQRQDRRSERRLVLERQ